MINIKLTWDCDVNASSYTVYKSEQYIDPNNLPNPLVNNLTQKTFTDTNVVVDIIYHYRVASYFEGNSYLSEGMIASISSQNLFIFDPNENSSPPSALAVNFTMDG